MIRTVGYVALFAVSYLLAVYVTFPWDSVKERVLQLASKQLRREITAKSLEPSWLTGIHAEKVEIDLQGSEEPMAFETVDARASVFSFLTGGYGGTLQLPIGGGQVRASASGGQEKVAVDLDAKAVELALVPALRASTGLALAGELGIDAELDLGLQDPQQSQGSIRLTGQGLETLKGGKAGNYPIPELNLGDLDWNLPVENGKVIIRNQRLEGPDLSLMLDGEIVLAKPPNRSLVNLTAKFKPTPEFLKREPLMASLLKNIDRYKGSDGFYGYQISGTVKRPPPRA
ncbi:MAG: type II secretion system protein GspN, partial [Myxococcota bacterium]